MITILLGIAETDWVQMASVIGTLGIGTFIAKFTQTYFKNRKERRAEVKAENTSDSTELKEEFKKRIDDLEEIVTNLQGKIEEMMEMYTEKVLQLSTEKATLLTKVEFLEIEIVEKEEAIKILRAKNKSLKR